MIISAIDGDSFVLDLEPDEYYQGRWIRESDDGKVVRRQALARCCSTSRAFLQVARPLLYRSIEIRGSPSSRIATCASLDRTPHLAGLVKTLRVSLESESHLEQLASVLCLCPAMKELRLTIWGTSFEDIEDFTDVVRLWADSHPARSAQLRTFSLAVFEVFVWGSFEQSLAQMFKSLDQITSLSYRGPVVDLRRWEDNNGLFTAPLDHLSLTLDRFSSSLLQYFTQNSTQTLSSLILQNMKYPWESSSKDERISSRRAFTIASAFRLRHFAILGYRLPRDPLPLLLALPTSFDSLVVPNAPVIGTFLASDACPSLQTMKVFELDETPLDSWDLEGDEMEMIQDALEKRGLFLVPIPDFVQVEEDEEPCRPPRRDRLQRSLAELWRPGDFRIMPRSPTYRQR